MPILALVAAVGTWGLGVGTAPAAEQKPPAASPEVERELLGRLDAPLLFVKRHSYTGIHIYDTYYKWPPGGGGIYVLENPSAPRAQWKVRPVVDPTTPGTPGSGVYTHPELSWDATRLLFCFKGEPSGNTCVYEVGIDGRGLRRVTDPAPFCDCYKGSHGGQHDIAPAYLPDGRIVFLSTRPSGLVPCFNTGVAILHVMNADGSDMHPISVNNVNEFDPSVLPDGRILFGRWEYVDKNALTIQSLWTCHPDGTNETAVYANNMVFPEAVLDARAVPGSPLIVATFAKHNSTPRGSIALIDPRKGKNDPRAAVNLEHPDDPTFDRGNSCEPWPVSEDVILFSGRPQGQARNVIEMMDRSDRRIVVLADTEICLHSPMLVKPRPRPPVLPDKTDRRQTTGRFFVQDIYQGLTGVKRGEVRWLRVIEETSRVSATPGGKQPYNQTFLVSAALAFSAKNYLGVVPVDEDGSAYFEVPSGRAVYFQALDADGRLVQSMRTFVQAAPGTTRSCIGCHEYKYGTSTTGSRPREILDRPVSRLRDESWGSGYVDYPSMVQPILDRHCVKCHGGPEGIAAAMDLSGGWTEHFSISYENLANRCETQLVAYWIAGIDCMNGTAWWSSQLFAPRGHGSGAAPLAKLLVSGHEGRIPGLTRTERDLLMAWIDSNGLYHGSWDYSVHGCAIKTFADTRSALAEQMRSAGCAKCHGDGKTVTRFENDWINLKDPERSRILRAPLPKGAEGGGLGLCRDRKVDPTPRVRLLWQGYAHAVRPLDAFAPQPRMLPNLEGPTVESFTSAADPHYQTMLAAIRRGREHALAVPRVDMPGADILPGACRQFLPPPVPDAAPPLRAAVDRDGLVQLSWERSARTIGLEAEVHRSNQERFQPAEATLLNRTTLAWCADRSAAAGRQYYALVLASGTRRSRPAYAAVSVPPPLPPPAASELKAVAGSCSVRLEWQAPRGASSMPPSYHVYRAKAGSNGLSQNPGRRTSEPAASDSSRIGSKDFQKITPEPVRTTAYTDPDLEPQVPYTYVVRTVSHRGVEGEATAPATAAAILVREPIFVAALAKDLAAVRLGGEVTSGKQHGPARVTGGSLDLARGGYVGFSHCEDFDLAQPLSVECWVRLDEPGKMPVVISCGAWPEAGWFLQRIGGGWRWFAGGINCDGGKGAVGTWVHLVGSFDGETARLFQDGKLVRQCEGTVNRRPWPGELCVGQYSLAQGPEYQVTGRIAGVKIYHRALDAAEVAAAAKHGP